MIAVVDYGMGNIHSVAKALELVGGEVAVSGNPKDLQEAERIVLPGVGAFGQAMARLKEMGLMEALEKQVIQNRKPFLGICLGMQLVGKDSDEWGLHNGLGWIDGHVRKFDATGLKVPHVGWNNITLTKKQPLLEGVRDGSDVYFVHSYRMQCPPENVAATCEYGGRFAAAITKGNIFATQFHPEKSQETGLRILENFLGWDGRA